jgi:hypothetical protein
VESGQIKPVAGFFSDLYIGNTDRALDRSIPGGFVRNTLHHFWHPEMDAVRSDPRFQRLLAELGLTEAHQRVMAWRAANQRTGSQRPEDRGQGTARKEAAQ